MNSAVQPSIDTALPRAVRAQMQRVSDRLAARAAASGEQPPTPAPNPAPDGGAPAPAASATNDDPPRADLAPPAAPASPAPSAAADPRENDPVYWKQRFKVTEGMLQRKSDEVRTRDQQITELQEQIATLKAQSATATPSKPDLSAFFTPEQINNFGEAQCEAMANAAMTAARQQAQALIDAEVRPIRDRAKQSAEQADADAEAAFWAKLAELEPEYEVINARQDWLVWLAQPDETTGLVRQDILDRHRQARNAAGVAKVFKSFKGTQQRPAPPVAAPRGAGPAEAPPAPPAAAAKGYPTREEIRDFHKRRATIRNPRDPRFVTEQEAVEFEARLRLKHAA